jgi:hypothetical protein
VKAMPKPPDQPTPPLPEPTYASVVLTTVAAELERTGNRRDLVSDIALRRAFTVSVAARLHTLPTAVADEVSKKVADLLPDPALIITRGACTLRLRQLAEAV